MILGAQYYSLRHKTQTEADLAETFRLTAQMGYHAVQLSGIGPIAPTAIADMSKKTGLPIVCTHSPFTRIVNETDALIAEHKLYGCTEIGLGCMPGEFPRTVEGGRAMLAALAEPVKKIQAAGLSFAYHNHDFEFVDLGGTDLFEMYIESNLHMNFILDTYWVTKAGRRVLDYINRLQGRIVNIHFKDMAKTEGKEICACGDGVIDFVPIIAACEKTGVKCALVEQDNAPDFPDAFAEMEKSCRHLTPLIYR